MSNETKTSQEEAIELVRAMVLAEIEVVKQVNSGGRITKAAGRREDRAAAALFEKLTGSKATDRQISEMVSA